MPRPAGPRACAAGCAHRGGPAAVTLQSVGRSSSTVAQLARLGFAEPSRTRAALLDTPLQSVLALVPDADLEEIVEALAEAPDPDLAALTLARLAEAVVRADRPAVTVRPVERWDAEAFGHVLDAPGPRRRRLFGVLGGSRALGDHLVAHPDHWPDAADAAAHSADTVRAHVTAAVRPQARGGLPAYDALRIAYRRELLRVAAVDLCAPDPVAHLPVAAESLAQLAEAALEAGLLVAREEYGPGHEDCRLAIIGMGKTGGGELNYVSDVDVIFVAEPAPGVDEQEALRIGTALATATMKACSASTPEGTLWPVDAALRPEGKLGPLVRTVASHKAYYERWAKTWEFQALLKAWVSAGDLDLGRSYKQALGPLIWSAAERENFVEDVQAMRRRVEQHVPAGEAGRQLKLGPGGLRDIEFSVQLLQLVHGRTDEGLRSATTLEALGALARGGYVGRDDAATLDEAYRVLRTLEHRIQLYRLRRTHLMPTDQADLRWLGRALGLRTDPEKAVLELWQSRAREVRRIHERLFYRPLLAAAARLSSSESALSMQQAQERFSALGFRDPAGAMRHLEMLTTGVSRRAAIQRTLLPVMLSWFADEADPDAGLLAFRRVSEQLGTTHWYLKMLRDEGSAAERLAHVLARSRYAADLLVRSPESVSILGDVDGLAPRTQEALALTLRSAARRKDDPTSAMAAVGALRRHELLRIALSDLTGALPLSRVGMVLSDLAAATVEVVLEVASESVGRQQGGLGVDLLVVGMGSLGGREMGYTSDIDAMVVHEAHDGVTEDIAQGQAVAVVQEMKRLAKALGQDGIDLDLDLRPEGKNGPLSRSLASFRTYYARWAQTWEFQALLRARILAGDPDLGVAFTELVDPLRYPSGGLEAAKVREVRTMKARVESERLPRGADPRTHLKLGRGGLTDVEWTAQLLQLRHAHAHSALRHTGTVPTIKAAARLGLLAEADAEQLLSGWRIAATVRNAGLLWRGRPVDAVPVDVRDADGVGRIAGRAPGEGASLMEGYLRQARRTRAVVDDVFYGSSPSIGEG